MTGELVEDLEAKRENAYKEAMKHRKKRDSLNDEAKKWMDIRDELNKKARNVAKEAAVHKEKRDELNQKVRDTKVLRDEWNKKYRNIEKDIRRLKKENAPHGGRSIGKLKAQLKGLEFKQQTAALSKEKEEEIIDLMRKLSKEIEELEKSLEDSDEVKKLNEEAEKIKEEAEKYHDLVSEHADAAQEEHERMVALFEEADAIRKQADDAQEKFVHAKVRSDEEHNMYIEERKKVSEFDKILSGLRHKRSSKGGAERRENENMERAREIYEKFKNGEKLSTDDLMLLQKSGFL